MYDVTIFFLGFSGHCDGERQVCPGYVCASAKGQDVQQGHLRQGLQPRLDPGHVQGPQCTVHQSFAGDS